MPKLMRTMVLAAALFNLVLILSPAPAAAELTAAERRQITDEIKELRSAVRKIRRRMHEYHRKRESVLDDLKAENQRLSTRVMKFSRQLRDGAKPVDTKPPAVTAKDVAATAKGTVGNAIANARDITANDQAFEETVEQAARAHLTTDRERIKEADGRFSSARSKWNSLRRARPTVTLEALCADCPAAYRGDWADLPRTAATGPTCRVPRRLGRPAAMVEQAASSVQRLDRAVD